MITRRVGAISGLLAIGLCIATVSQAHAQAQGSIVQRVTALESAVSSLQTAIGNLQSKLTADEGTLATLGTTVSGLQTSVGSLQSKLTSDEGTLATLQGQVAGIQANGALALAPYASVQTGDINGLTGPHVIFAGANIHIRSGSGFTDDNTTIPPRGKGGASSTTNEFGGDGTGTLQGLGNLVIGYDESFGGESRTGSHNLVIGPFHTFSSWGGTVAGFGNSITGSASSVTGGGGNTASGKHSSVSGGVGNTASEDSSSVSGGQFNTASGILSSVSGGRLNTASGFASSVGGGKQRSASDTSSWAAGSLFEAF